MSDLILNPSQTAVLVMDCQNDLIHSDGKLAKPEVVAEIEHRGMLEKINRLISVARQLEMPVIFIRHAYRSGYPEVPAGVDKFEAVRSRDALKEGSWGASTVDVLDQKPGDVDISKSRISAFHGTELDTILRSFRVSHLLMTGYSTHNVVEGSVRQGADLDYHCCVVSDCCAATSQALHESAIHLTLPQYSTVLKLEQALIALTG